MTTVSEEQVESLIQVARQLAVDLDKGAEAMLNLAARRREIIVILRTEHKMSITQIGAELGISTGRIYQILNPGKPKEPEIQA